MDLKEYLALILVGAICILFALYTFPLVHNSINPCTSWNASNTLQCYTWSNTTPLSSAETGMLTLIPFVFAGAIVLIPVGLLYYILQK
jgi:hypothetical protein